MTETSFDRLAALAVLERSLQRLQDLLQTSSTSDWHVAPASGEWSAAATLEHVIAADAVIAPRVFQLLVRPGMLLPAFDERRWGEVIRRSGSSVSALVALLSARRLELIGVLRSLEAHEWEVAGRHEVKGQVTIEDCVAGLLEHERDHIEQIAIALASVRR